MLTMQNVLSCALASLQLLGIMQTATCFVSYRFKRIPTLDGVNRPGAFESLPDADNEFTCASSCVKNGCVSFVYNVGKRTCFYYDWPLNATSSSNTENSVAYFIVEDVVAVGRHLYHPILNSKKAWVIILPRTHTWQQANDDCSQKDGELLPIVDTDWYKRFNDLDAKYPGILKSGGTYDTYFIGLNDIQTEGVWQNVDLSAGAGLLWRFFPGAAALDCGSIWHNANIATTFKLQETDCAYQLRYVCQFDII